MTVKIMPIDTVVSNSIKLKPRRRCNRPFDGNRFSARLGLNLLLRKRHNGPALSLIALNERSNSLSVLLFL